MATAVITQTTAMERRAKYLQKQKKAKQLAEDLKALNQSTSGRVDEQIKLKEEHLCDVLDIPLDKWTQQGDNISLQSVISRYDLLLSDVHAILNFKEEMNSILNFRGEITPAQLVANASGGLALKGVLVGESYEPKKTVLTLPKEVTVMEPTMHQFSEMKEISSKQESDHFLKTLDTMGYSVATSSLGSSEYGAIVQRQGTQHFHSQIVCMLVPTVAVKLNLEKLRLTQDAIQELTKIAKVVRLSDDKEKIRNSCELFFERYGTHVNAGLIHFGGINIFEATYWGKAKSNTRKTRSMVNEALNTYSSMSYSGFGVNVGGSVTGDHVKSQSSSYSSTELLKVHLRTSRTGGPGNVTLLPLWKTGLMTFTSTWALIDRGESFTDSFAGVWELIPNHTEFADPFCLASTLKGVWQQVQETAKDDHLYAAFSQIGEMETLVETWVSDPEFPNHALHHLQSIFETVKEVEREAGSRETWSEMLCKNGGAYSAFLVQLVDLQDQLAPQDVPMIQCMVRLLLNFSGPKYFRGRDQVMMWVGVSAEKDAEVFGRDVVVRDIPELLTTFREKLVPHLQTQHTKYASSAKAIHDGIDAQATIETALMVKSVSLSSKRERLFFHACLLEIDYDWAMMNFKTMLSIEKLQDFIGNAEGKWKKFEPLMKKGLAERDAFLLHLLLQSSYFRQNQQTKENDFSEIIGELRQVISPEVNQVLNAHATSQFNWRKLTEFTGQMAQGDFSCLEETAVDLQKLRTALSSRPPETASQASGPTKTKPTDEAYKEILTKLGLSEYYPRHISLQQVTTIRKHPTELEISDLPWELLQMLIMFDYRARDSLLSSFQNSEGENTDEDLSTFDFGESSVESCNDDNIAVSPLDLLLATFSCCDGILQQVVSNSLFMCKLAIPFLYPVASPDDLVFSLWALRTIVVEWRNEKKEAMETAVTDSLFPVSTFVRLGRPTISKSKLLNDILRDDTHHTFFNPECQNSAFKRTIADGMVECSWFLPGKENDIFKNVSLMLNLRGDGSSHHKQLQFLGRISSVTVAIANIEEIARTPNIEKFEELCKAGKKVILLLTSKSSFPDMEMAKIEWQNCIEHIGKENLKGLKRITTFKRGGMTASNLKNEVRNSLSNVLEDCSKMSLVQAANIAEEYGFLVDEHDPRCVKGKQVAENVMKHMQEADIVKCKMNLLPLQGKVWLDHSDLLKKQYKTGDKANSPKFVSDLQKEMIRLRQEQVEICKNLTPFCEAFLKSLLQTDQEVKLYFLQWMKLFLDVKSRFYLPKLKQRYHKLWSSYQEHKRNETSKNEQLTKLQDEVLQAEQNLANASFGLENLFRELGQIYEAIHECSLAVDHDSTRMIEQLPETAARLLLRGNPLEFVDGDASNIPLTWIKAVLSKLEELIEDQKLFVISVLGIQSSGKSTLLNAMFGLKFAVSAGRCTRGAFMQVIKVNDPDLPMGYIAVVDTEGLRAPELAQAKYNHDNELATLAIGLADVTLMNIKGENTAEVQDILQIAVHAFMRMKLVSKHLNMHQSCFFIHQNVPAVNAKEKTMQGCQKLQETLDSMTQEAAQGEIMLNIHSFSQIIGFDVHDHVWHFLDLWHGNPPMAPANPGYSEKVNSVRLSLLEKMAKNQLSALTISSFLLRIEDLWKGILADNFVFSFRNSLEVKAYSSLEAKYHELEWELQSTIVSWMRKAENEISSCETVEDLDMRVQTMFNKLNQVINEQLGITRKSLEEYFEKSNLQNIMIQWKPTKLIALSIDAEKRHAEGQKHLLAVKEAHRVDLLRKAKWEKHEHHITSKAVELADQLKGKETSEEELSGHFSKMWIPIVNELASEYREEELPMDTTIESILWSRFYAHRHLLAVELQRNPLSEPINLTSLERSIKIEDVYDTDISLMPTYFGLLKKIGSRIGFSKHPMVAARNKAFSVTCQILQEIDMHLQNLCSQDIKFQESQATNVIRMLTQGVGYFNETNSKKCHFSILPRFTVKLAVHVSRHCVQLFTKRQDQYEKKHGIVAKLEAYKETTWNLFRHTVKQSTEEVVAADLFCSTLKEMITHTVTRQVPQKIVDEVVRDFSVTKHDLILRIMEDLANKGDFKQYSCYITNAKTFAFKWITQYTNETIFSVKTGRKLSRYEELTKSHVQTITRRIEISVERSCEKVMGLSDRSIGAWMKAFCEEVKEDIPVGPNSLKLVATRNIADFLNFQRLVLIQLGELKNTLARAFSEHKGETIKWEGVTPYQQILDELWGCPAQCPFCGEPCSQTATDHYTLSKRPHSCLQHRPEGIGGGRWEGTTIDGVLYQDGELSTQTCNFFIQWKEVSFMCGVCRYECKKSGKCDGKSEHEYLDYKTYLPEWDIAPDPTNSASVYWSWFMATYQHQLKDMHDAKLPSIPQKWLSYTKEDALKDLRKSHN